MIRRSIAIVVLLGAGAAAPGPASAQLAPAPAEVPGGALGSTLGSIATHPYFLSQGDPRFNPYAANSADPFFRSWMWNQYQASESNRSTARTAANRARGATGPLGPAGGTGSVSGRPYDNRSPYEGSMLNRYYAGGPSNRPVARRSVPIESWRAARR